MPFKYADVFVPAVTYIRFWSFRILTCSRFFFVEESWKLFLQLGSWLVDRRRSIVVRCPQQLVPPVPEHYPLLRVGRAARAARHEPLTGRPARLATTYLLIYLLTYLKKS